MDWERGGGGGGGGGELESLQFRGCGADLSSVLGTLSMLLLLCDGVCGDISVHLLVW